MATILLIDDDGLFRALVASTLEKAGHYVLQAKNGRDGLSLYHKFSPDLVLTDIFMPEMDGIELTIALLKLSPAPHIIAMSAGANVLDADSVLHVASRFGVLDTMSKPISTKGLLQKVETSLAA